MKRRIFTIRILALIFSLALACAAWPAHADKKPQQQVKPMAGPRATALRATWLYITASTGSEKVSKLQIGREMVVAEKSGAWMRVYINTDIVEQHSDKDEPWVGGDAATPPISGWIEGKGVVEETMSNGDQILMGAAANEEAEASNPRGAANAAQSARLLYRRLVEMFPNSPLVPDAMWRAADIQWQIQRADSQSLPSAHEKDPAYRQAMDEDELRKVIKYYPKTKWAALAAFNLIDNKLCGDWQGTEQCPSKESELYIKYADEYPDGPRTARALYEAVYRLAVLTDMYAADGDDRKSGDAHNQARALAAQLRAHFPDSDYTYRAGALVYKLDEGVPVYGIDRD
ncbi:MAG TPA: hypothetical protein VJX73_03705 [Terracidiphilus sp.]|nr:hypothetical protein [Terracidiphilus sp.]